MITLFIRVTLAALAVGFAGWFGYIIYLGLKQFFSGKNNG